MIIWYGTVEERDDILTAIGRNCTCILSAEGMVEQMCGLHKTFENDQSFSNNLIYGRRIADRLRKEEFEGGGKTNNLKRA